MTNTEQRLNRRLTQRFIQTSPQCVRLHPYEREKDDQGGWRYVAQELRPSQTFRFIESGQPGSNAASTIVEIDGVRREIELEILGEHCAEMAVNDRFELDGIKYEIVQIWPDNGWEKRGSVIRRG